MNEEEWDRLIKWWKSLNCFRIYPDGRINLHPDGRMGFYESPQCDGCYEILKPDDDIQEFMIDHFAHRWEVLQDVEIPKEGIYKSPNSYQTRRRMLDKFEGRPMKEIRKFFED